eukprot:scaffold9.g3115.t1
MLLPCLPCRCRSLPQHSSLAYVPLHTLHLAGASPGADAAAQAAPLPVPVEQLALAGSDAATHVGLHIDGGALVVVLLLGAALLALSGKSLAGLSLLTQRAQPGGQAASHEHRLHMEPSALDLLFSQDDITDTEDEGRGSGFTQKGYYKPSLRRH